ncbi:kinase-like domain-containing protein [Rhizophagus clarus]|nr:kinase-like domain-containing protein [Rhizophagus clarus]
MWELTSKIPPFNNRAHDFQLALSICKGERPEIIENTPQCYIDLMKKCWDEDPLKRPSAHEVHKIIEGWIFQLYNGEISEGLKSNIMEFINAPIGNINLTTGFHSQAFYTSRLLDLTSKELNKNLKEPQELIILRQKNSQPEQNIQNLKLEFTEKENILQTQITLTNDLTKQLEQNKLINQQFQIQINQLNQEKNNLQNQLIQFQNNYKQIENENFKLEKIAETYYQISQNKLNENQIELVDLQQKNFQFEQDYQNIQIELIDLQQKNSVINQKNQYLNLKLATQDKEFAEKENTLQNQIIYLQNEIYEKQILTSNLTEQLKQNKLTNQKVQIQIDQLKQEKYDLKEKLNQTETSIQNLKSQQESLIKQKEQVEIKLKQSQDNYEQMEQKSIELHGLLADHRLSIKLKAKLEKEIAQLGQKLNNEKKIKEQLNQTLQIKENRINKLEQELINLDNKRIKQLKDKEKELSNIKQELVNKLTKGEDTKKTHKEKEAKQKEMDRIKQELLRTSASYNANRKKQVLNQVDRFIGSKSDFLTLQEDAIEKLQNCYNYLESSTTDKGRSANKHTEEFQNTLTKYNNELLKLNEDYNFLMNIIQENNDFEDTLNKINNILKLDSFNIDRYDIFKFATNFQEGTRIKLDSSMMAEDIKSLRKKMDELKAEVEQERKELKNLK